MTYRIQCSFCQAWFETEHFTTVVPRHRCEKNPLPSSLRIFKHFDDAILPRLALSESIGYDLHAYLKTESGRPSTRTIPSQSVVAVPCGLSILAPSGYSLLVCSRSGLASRALFVANAPGVIDPDYTGEIVVLLFNGGWETAYVKHEDRIAQVLVIPRPVTPGIDLIPSLPETERGGSGFGSTGR